MDERLKRAIEELVEESKRPDIENTETHKLAVELYKRVSSKPSKPKKLLEEAWKIRNEKRQLASTKCNDAIINSEINKEYKRISIEYKEFSDKLIGIMEKEWQEAELEYHKTEESIDEGKNALLGLFGFNVY